MIEIIGILATILIVIAYVPQLIQVLKAKSAENVNGEMFSILIISNILWIIYGININAYSIILCNGLNLIQSTIIIYYKYNNQIIKSIKSYKTKNS
ncbi:MAG: SemiSWEET family transporter [Candidatus Muirbacterium halophilum]|nr:SemiSWEET family transporter [Candidatus Muirbacterium halophilum]